LRKPFQDAQKAAHSPQASKRRHLGKHGILAALRATRNLTPSKTNRSEDGEKRLTKGSPTLAKPRKDGPPGILSGPGQPHANHWGGHAKRFFSSFDTATKKCVLPTGVERMYYPRQSSLPPEQLFLRDILKGEIP